MNSIKSSFTELVNNLKSIATLSKDVIIVLVIAFILLWPVDFKKIMEQAGFKELDLGIVQWESRLEASTARLEDANQVMEQYQQELGDIKISVNALTESPNLDEDTKAEIVKINDRIEKTWESSSFARENIEDNITQQNQMLKEVRKEQSLPPPPPSGQWAVVAGADRELDAAMYEVNKLKEQGYHMVQLWRRDGWYRTVIIFENRETAENNLKKLKRVSRETAFITNLNEWCPEPVEIEDGLIFECKNR